MKQRTSPIDVSPTPGTPGKPSATPGAVIAVRVQVRSRRPGLGPRVGSEWTVRVSVAPVEGRANRAVIAALAEALGLPPSSVELLTGANSTHKRFRITGHSQDEAEALLEAAL